MDEQLKRYLDLAGLKHYDEKIKAFIKAGGSDVTDKLIALIGAAEKGADEATILARIAAIEEDIGKVADLAELGEDLTKAILGESARAKAAEKENADAIAALDTKLHGDAEKEDDIGELAELKAELEGAFSDAIKALDADKDDTAAGVTVGVTEADGVITAVSVEVADNAVAYVAATTGENAEAAKVTVADTAAVLKGDAVAEILKYVDAMDEANAGDADEAVKALEEKLYGDTNDANDKGDMGAQDAKIAALEALHAVYGEGVEGHTAGEMKTVATEVNEAVTALVNGAPEALDTLKEIADWIANQDENGVTDVASLVSRVDTLAGDESTVDSVKKQIKDAVDALDATVTNKVEKAEGATEEPAQPSVVVTVSEVDGKLTQIAVDASVIEGRVEELEGLMGEDSVEDQIKEVTGTPDENKTLQDEIDDIEELIGTLPSTSDNVIDYVDDSIDALDAEVENQEVPATGENFQTSGVHVKVTEADGVLTAVTASINTITTDDIDALFEAKTPATPETPEQNG